MITGKDIKNWAMSIATAATIGLMGYAASTLNDVDRTVVGIEKHLEFIVKTLGDHSDTLKDHENRLRQLESRERTK